MSDTRQLVTQGNYRQYGGRFYLQWYNRIIGGSEMMSEDLN